MDCVLNPSVWTQDSICYDLNDCRGSRPFLPIYIIIIVPGVLGTEGVLRSILLFVYFLSYSALSSLGSMVRRLRGRYVGVRLDSAQLVRESGSNPISMVGQGT